MADLLPVYSKGTVSVANGGTTVTGVGTNFNTALLRAGDIFFKSDLSAGSMITEEPSSPTSLKIEAWPGSSLSAGSNYKILRLSDATRFIDATAQFLQALVPNLSAFGALQGTADKVPYFTGAGAVSLTGLSNFARTVLDDANATAALATLGADDASNLSKGTLADARLRGTLGASGGGAIPGNNYNNATEAGWYVGSGGSAINGPPDGAAFGPLFVLVRFAAIIQIAVAATGGTRHVAFMRSGDTSTNTWQAWERIVLNNNIVGTVAMSSGDPSGSLFERGNNANGDWQRKADGSQKCIVSIDDGAASYTLASGGIYVRTSPLVWTFPSAFSATPKSISGSVRRDQDLASGIHVRTISASSVSLQPWMSVSMGAFSKVLHLEAEGRWA